MVSLDASRHYSFLGYFYTVVVVRGNKQKGIVGEVIDDVGHAFVIAGMGVFYGIPNWRFVVVLLSEFTLLVHISTSDELDA